MPIWIEGHSSPGKPVAPPPAMAPVPAAQAKSPTSPSVSKPGKPPKAAKRAPVRDKLVDANLASDRRRRGALKLRVREDGEAVNRDRGNERRSLKTIEMPIERLAPATRRGRRLSVAQLARLRTSLCRFGFVAPIVIDREHRIISGHGLVEAAKDLGYETVPVVIREDLSPADAELLALTLNRLGETGEWDIEALKPILADFVALEEDLGLVGFDDSFVDTVLASDEDDLRPEKPLEVPETITSRLGDVWELGDHLVACMDARDHDAMAALIGDRELRAAFIDPPYNVPIKGHVTSKAHKTFVMGAGEMSDEVFQSFLVDAFRVLCDRIIPGGVVFACMDWRSIDRLMAAARTAGFEVFNLVCWDKGAGGQPGGLYRSAHELVLVLRKAGGEMVNLVKGRYRTNVWAYPGGASLGSEAREGLKSHSTPKNPTMVADAIADVSHRGELVADTFLGGGTTLIAAERTGRVFAGGDLDPLYVDVAILRWQRETRDHARLAGTGETFEQVARRRATEAEAALADAPASAPDPD